MHSGKRVGGDFNYNVNNNASSNFSKPDVPSKPQHLTAYKPAQNVNLISPRRWQPQNENASIQEGWRPAPKIIPKYKAENSISKAARNASKCSPDAKERNIGESPVQVQKKKLTNHGENGNSDNKASFMSAVESHGWNEDYQSKGFGSLKRMWNEKSKDSHQMQDLRLLKQEITRQLSAENSKKSLSKTESNDLQPDCRFDTSSSSSSLNSQLSRSTSSSSNCSIHPASFKKKSTTWHYVTVTSPTDNIPQEIEPQEPPLLSPVRKGCFDFALQSPRPYRNYSVDHDNTMFSAQISKPDSMPSNASHNEVSSKINHDRPSTASERATKDLLRGRSSSSEMDRKGDKNYVTKFDANGNLYTVDANTGEVTFIEDTYTVAEGTVERSSPFSRSKLTKMDAVLLEEEAINESSKDSRNYHRKSTKHSSTTDSEVPPPLLPRDRIPKRPQSSVVPPPSNLNTSTRSITRSSHRSAFHDTRNRSHDRTSETYDYQPMDPDSKVPPPLLPRGEPPLAQDYTPMAGVDRVSREPSIDDQVSSVEDIAYEPMEPVPREADIFNYSAAVDPPFPKLSVREYHEIDPDPDVPIGLISPPVLDPGSVPPPPDSKPPTLPAGTKTQSQSSVPPASPPPLPPMNQREKRGPKKLNYIEVEVGSGDTDYKFKRKSQNVKTNYTEVIVGSAAASKENGDPKKGKSVKGKIMSMFASKHHDGYSSEGDIISESKDTGNPEERATDFSKERNALKRLSGRLLRKKKQRSRDEVSRQSADLDSSHFHSSASSKEHKNTTAGVSVGVYGSTTNLSTTSSESSRSLSHVTSTSLSGSSGDGQASIAVDDKRRQKSLDDGDGSHTAQTVTDSEHNIAARRQSYEPALTQLPPKLEKKSRSEMQLNTEMKTYLQTQDNRNIQPRSAESTPSRGYQAQRTGKGIEGSPIVAPRVPSHLHQRTENKVLPRLPTNPQRPLSEDAAVGASDRNVQNRSPRPTSSPVDTKLARSYAQRSSNAAKVRPLPLEKQNVGIYREQLSPNFPTDSPPSPPSLGNKRETTAPSTLGNEPPTPMRDLKPDRFRKRRDFLSSGSTDSTYSPALDVPHVENSKETEAENSSDPIYDTVASEGEAITRSRKFGSSKSKLLESEPLYQVYRSRTLSHASMRMRNRDPDQRRRLKSAAVASYAKRYPGDIWQSDLMTDDAGATTLWKEVKEVVTSGVGQDLTREQMKLQQAQFEVVTSQASYMRSLNILTDHFMRDWAMESTDVLPKAKRKQLFSNIEAVREIEQNFLQDIEQHFWSNLYLTDVAKITAQYARSDFEVYVRYVQNQVYQDRVLTDLQRNNEKFSIELSRLEASPFCNKLPLLSFLLLPMQRVTRLPLLISAIVNQADSANDTEAYNAAKQALAVVNKLVKKCNEGARKMQQTEQLAEIASELAFAPKVKTYALVSQSRSLVKKGEMAVTITQDNKKPKASKLHLFLFTDVLLMARKKSFLEAGSNIKYEVIDWAKRAMLYVNERAVSEDEIFLVFLENCLGKRVELTLSPASQNELSRWTDALNPQRAEESGDSIYESWDCPQYQCIVPYNATQPDELTLDVGDVMRVVRKTTDGWLEGERLRDNELGWFPAENCEEIEDEHVRARNLKNLYRIIPAGGLLQE